jgi:hypothetical protein
MSDLVEELIVLLTTVWWLQKLRSLNRRAAQKFDMERFNLKNLNDVEVKERFQVKISNTKGIQTVRTICM